MTKILITALGTMNSTFIAKYLKQKGYYVIGTDIYPNSYVQTSYEIDKFIQVPSIFDINNFEKKLLDICFQNKVEYLIPIIDEEVLYFSKNRDKYLNIGTKICAPSIETVEICRNKYNTFEFIKHNIPEIYIPTYKLSDFHMQIDLPLFCKPISGRASFGCFAIKDVPSLKYIQEKFDKTQYIIQPYIDGRFFTIDFINNPNNKKCYTLAREELVRNKNGCGTVVHIVKDTKIENIVSKIAQILNYQGVGNVELILDKNERLNLIEINPRFSAGTEYSVRSGMKLIENEIKITNGETEFLDCNINYNKIFTRRYETYESK